ncbi:hypothetical protein IAD21_00882 [Abditibacteriota bacterium]|nr:hypothetical protein IAD21_00882 [Abditibacteriota bacterium]
MGPRQKSTFQKHWDDFKNKDVVPVLFRLLKLGLYSLYVFLSAGIITLLFAGLEKTGTPIPNAIKIVIYTAGAIVMAAFLWANNAPDASRFTKQGLDETLEPWTKDKKETDKPKDED